MNEVTLSVVAGAWLAASAGAVTGVIDVRLRRTPDRDSSLVLGGLAGAALGALTYGVFLVVGVAVSVLTFSSAPDAWPALLGVIIGCPILLGVRGIQMALTSHFGMPERRVASQPRTLTDLLDARPIGGPGTMWLGGIGFALLPLSYGVKCIVTGRGDLGTSIWPSDVHGGAAIALGVGWIGVGLFLHFHFFFGLHPKLSGFSRRGRWIALTMALAGFTAAGAWSVVAQIPR